MKSILSLACAILLAGLGVSQAWDDRPKIAAPVSFVSTFDDTCDANLSGASGRIRTAETIARKKVQEGEIREDVEIAKDAGKFGDALHFKAKSKKLLFYTGDEIYLPENSWSLTFSFWLKLDPNKDLEPGYCDPLQMTQKTWNDASIFVDFDKELPRDFRLGVFPDYKQWNPDDIPWDKVPVEKRPMVTVKNPPFSRDQWTHVAFTVDNVNPKDDSEGTAALYLNGKHQGTLRQKMRFSWEQEKVAIMLGINYIGYLDELVVFDKALSAEEVQTLYNLPKGIRSIL